MRDKALLVGGEPVKVGLVVGQVDLLGRPEAGLGLLVGAPDLRVLDREQHEALLVGQEDGLGRVERVLFALGVHARWLRLRPGTLARTPRKRVSGTRPIGTSVRVSRVSIQLRLELGFSR